VEGYAERTKRKNEIEGPVGRPNKKGAERINGESQAHICRGGMGELEIKSGWTRKKEGEEREVRGGVINHGKSCWGYPR